MEFSSSSLNLYHVNDYQMSFCILSLTTESLHYESSTALQSLHMWLVNQFLLSACIDFPH